MVLFVISLSDLPGKWYLKSKTVRHCTSRFDVTVSYVLLIETFTQQQSTLVNTPHTHTFINHQSIRIICVMAWFNSLLNYTNRLQLAFIYGPQSIANLKFSIWFFRNRKIKFSNISAMLLRCKYKSKLKANRHMKHWRSFADMYGIWHISTNLKMSKSPFAFPP